jgi:hypothetical protein
MFGASSAATARNEVVVLPSVPVMPTIPSSWLGSRYHQQDALARAAVERSTTSWGRLVSATGRSTIATDAPLLSACAT